MAIKAATLNITPKINKVVAHVDLVVDGKTVGTAEVDVTHLLEPEGIPGKTGTVLDGPFNVYADGNKSTGQANAYTINVGNKGADAEAIRASLHQQNEAVRAGQRAAEEFARAFNKP